MYTSYFDASRRKRRPNFCSGYRVAKWRTSIVDDTVSNLGVLTYPHFVNLTHAPNTKSRQRVGIELAVPDHSTLGRRAPTVTLPKMDAPSCWAPAIDRRQHGSELNGPGEWRIEKNGTTKRR
jgi:hypothetical protein